MTVLVVKRFPLPPDCKQVLVGSSAVDPVHILSGRNHGVLVGEPGVGKTAIAEGLAMRIVGYVGNNSQQMDFKLPPDQQSISTYSGEEGAELSLPKLVNT